MDGMPIERIVWRDSRIEVYQIEPAEIKGPTIIGSVGVLIFEADDYLVLARDAVGAEWRGVLTIPKENIVARTEIGRY